MSEKVRGAKQVERIATERARSLEFHRARMGLFMELGRKPTQTEVFDELLRLKLGECSAHDVRVTQRSLRYTFDVFHFHRHVTGAK